MGKDKRLVEASCWEGLAVAESGSCSEGQGMLSKYLIQFSVNGWGVCSLPVVWPEAKLW